MSERIDWYRVENPEELFSPSIIFYPERIKENIRRMSAAASDPGRLRPHVKTHKTGEIVGLQVAAGITKFKCATISEAEMAAANGASDVLLAMQPVGPGIKRLLKLRDLFPRVLFSCIADTELVLRELSEAASATGRSLPVWLDINAGMNRTGIQAGPEAVRLYMLIKTLPGLVPGGLHVYDGHIHEKDPALRKQICDAGFGPAEALATELGTLTGEKVKIIAGGTPSFHIHCQRKEVELSPGTTLLWDWGYSSTYPDLDYLHAAVLFTRVISKPAENMICLDLGHKAVGSEMPHPRVNIFGLDNCLFTGHNEEHLVVKAPGTSLLRPGAALYALPWHICPTVDRHDKAYVAYNGKVTGQWDIVARRRMISV